MNSDAKEVFLNYFGAVDRLYLGLAVTLFVLAALVWIYITIKAFRDRSEEKNKDDMSVFMVVLRGLVMLLFLVAIFMFS